MKYNREIEGSSTPPAWMTTLERKPRPAQALDKCANCGEKFTLPRSNSIDAIDLAGLFCTLRCAASYGVRVATSELPASQGEKRKYCRAPECACVSGMCAQDWPTTGAHP